MHEMNQSESEDRLVEALRHLAQQSSRAPSAQLGAELATAFRRHHRRRRTRKAIAVMALCCIVSVAWLLTMSTRKAAPYVAVDVRPSTKTAVAPDTTNALVPTAAELNANAHVKKALQHGLNSIASQRRRTQLEARQAPSFLPLPTYDPVGAKDELQIIRVEMPIQDLRLVGAPVGADVPNRLVQADFAVGRDGTPYGVRLVQ